MQIGSLKVRGIFSIKGKFFASQEYARSTWSTIASIKAGINQFCLK